MCTTVGFIADRHRADGSTNDACLVVTNARDSGLIPCVRGSMGQPGECFVGSVIMSDSSAHDPVRATRDVDRRDHISTASAGQRQYPIRRVMHDKRNDLVIIEKQRSRENGIEGNALHASFSVHPSTSTASHPPKAAEMRCPYRDWREIVQIRRVIGQRA